MAAGCTGIVNLFLPTYLKDLNPLRLQEEVPIDFYYLLGYHQQSFHDLGNQKQIQENIIAVGFSEDLLSSPANESDELICIGSYFKTAKERLIENTKPCKGIHIVLKGVHQQSVYSIDINGTEIPAEFIRVIHYCPSEIASAHLLNPAHGQLPDCPNNTNPLDYLISTVLARQATAALKQESSPFLKKALHSVSSILMLPLYLCQLQCYLKKVTGYESAILEEISQRCNEIKEITKQTQPPTVNTKESRYLVRVRLLSMIAFDLLLGTLMVSFLLSYGHPILFQTFKNTTEFISSSVLSLLEWLRGAPAGLKLNQPLTRALASFFSYHVSLWTLYLQVSEGVVYYLCLLFMWSGVLGASIQLALFADILHFITLHLHCFYIYAARLHMVQFSLLGSQWRAFRGRKHNPLKGRVDSLLQPRDTKARPGVWPGPASQPLSRVMTAVVFTLVLFLLPTTTVYYLVFLSLRLLLFAARGLVFLLIWAIHCNPIAVVLLHSLSSDKVKGEVCLSLLPPSGPSPHFRLQVAPCSLWKVVGQASRSPVLPRIHAPSLGGLVCSVLYARKLL